MRTKVIIPGVFCVTFSNQRDLGLSSLRISEFCMAAKNHRHRAFDWEKFLTKIIDKKTGEVDYFSVWAGFTIYGKEFMELACDHKHLRKIMTETERNFIDQLYNLIIANGYNKKNHNFCIIVYIDSDRASKNHFKHELAHALYTIDENYKAGVLEILNEIPPGELKKLKNKLGSTYNKQDYVLTDEAQAYLAANTKRQIYKYFKYDITPVYSHVYKLRKLLKTTLKNCGTKT